MADWCWGWCCETPPVVGCCDTNGCGNLVFDDGFTTVKGGYTTTAYYLHPAYIASGGSLTETSGQNLFTGANGDYTQSIEIPPLDGLCMSVSALISSLGQGSGGNGAEVGIVIQDIGFLTGVWNIFASTNFPYRLARGSRTIPIETQLIGPFGSSFATPTCITLVLRDTSGGAGTYSLTAYIAEQAFPHGQYTASFTGLALLLTPGNHLNLGVMSFQCGKWNNLCIRTSGALMMSAHRESSESLSCCD